jgi:hypothetical protein
MGEVKKTDKIKIMFMYPDIVVILIIFFTGLIGLAVLPEKIGIALFITTLFLHYSYWLLHRPMVGKKLIKIMVLFILSTT